ncbi:PIN domain-containing protein [Streptomyces sp. NPDC056341]|uniref:PIN domain-containing protein n=1 Tax=Streptomyces sp. NPDC056341 TaxID=3345788 RepID=UPI0035E17215
MIILDSSIVRSFNLHSANADLLRAIRLGTGQSVAVPWMALEELVAQQAIKYRDKHERARQAISALDDITPWGAPDLLDSLDLDRIRDHWRAKLGELFSVVETTEGALREAAFREANRLPPCNVVRDVKTGMRDAAIWLSAVEYAREHPDETVYFVSSNTNDFGSGAPYPSPMDKDVRGLEGRFKHLTSMDEVAAEFAQPVETDIAWVTEALEKHSSGVISGSSEEGAFLLRAGQVRCTVPAKTPGEYMAVPVYHFETLRVRFAGLDSAKAYQINETLWVTASARWHLGGAGIIYAPDGFRVRGGCSWTVGVLFKGDESQWAMSVLRAEAPVPLPVDDLERLDLATAPRGRHEEFGVSAYEVPDQVRWDLARYGLRPGDPLYPSGRRQ